MPCVRGVVGKCGLPGSKRVLDPDLNGVLHRGFKPTKILVFRGVLGLANTKQTVRVNVDEDDKRKLEELQGRNETLRLDSNKKNTIFLNESGLCSLIMRSEKPEATPLDSGLTIKRKWRS